jgi:hypothetical protein
MTTNERAAQLERDADLLRSSLLAPSMAERAMREEAAALRAEVNPFDVIRRALQFPPVAGFDQLFSDALAALDSIEERMIQL